MRTSNYSNGKVIKKINQFFDKSVINRIGKSSGFVQRKAVKITAYHFVAGFIACCCGQLNTFSHWAAQIELLSGQSISKQAVFKRLYGKKTSVFVEKLLQHVIIERSRALIGSSLFKPFGKVILQDSTVLRLPDILAAIFKGNTTNGQQKSQARIQTIFDLKAMRFLQFTLGSFTQNDQSASGQILSCAGKGDLVIRDLGYFVLGTFKDIIDSQACFLSRMRYGVLLFHPNGRPIKIMSLIKSKKVVDMQVLIGKHKLPVRLVMLPLPKAQAAERARKARCNRDRRLNHKEDYYKLLAYSVFITTVDKETWSPEQAGQAYKVRWQIEIIFKSWKSGGNMQAMLHENITSEERVRVTIYLFLLFVCLMMNKIYLPLRQKIERQHEKHVSLLKFTAYMFCNFFDIIGLSATRLANLIAYNCCYERREDRVNMTDLYYNLNN